MSRILVKGLKAISLAAALALSPLASASIMFDFTSTAVDNDDGTLTFLSDTGLYSITASASGANPANMRNLAFGPSVNGLGVKRGNGNSSKWIDSTDVLTLALDALHFHAGKRHDAQAR